MNQSPVTLRFGPRDGETAAMADLCHILETYWHANIPGPDGNWLDGCMEIWRLQYRRSADDFNVVELSLMEKAGYV